MKDVEYFRKNYPDSCYGDKPLSPYWDFFQDGVEFSERQSEKKIEDLEETINKAKELIKKLKALYLYPVVTKDDVKQQNEILTEAEQFLSEVEK